MGTEKDRLIDRDEAWKQHCRSTGYICQMCHEVPQRGDTLNRELCASCRYRLENG